MVSYSEHCTCDLGACLDQRQNDFLMETVAHEQPLL